MSLARYYSGKTIWIIGASSGIGAQLAIALSRYAEHLVLSARNKSELQRVAGACQTGVATCSVWPLDLAEPARAAYARLTDAFARIDCVVCAAAISQRSHFLDLEPHTIDTLLQVNLISYVALAHEAVRHFCARGGGQIVFVGSIAGFVSTPVRSIYSATKAALHSLAAAVRVEAEAYGTKVQLVVPGFIRTPISRNALTGDGSSYQVLDRLQARGMTAEKCARKIVRFLPARSFRLMVGMGIKGRVIMLVAAVFPALMLRMLRRARVT